MFFLLDYQVFEYEFDEVSRVKVVVLVVVYHSCEWQNFELSHVIFELCLGFKCNSFGSQKVGYT